MPLPNAEKQIPCGMTERKARAKADPSLSTHGRRRVRRDPDALRMTTLVVSREAPLMAWVSGCCLGQAPVHPGHRCEHWLFPSFWQKTPKGWGTRPEVLQFHCEASPPPANVLRVAPSRHVVHDGVLGTVCVCGISTVPASAFTLLPSTDKQYQRVLPRLSHL